MNTLLITVRVFFLRLWLSFLQLVYKKSIDDDIKPPSIVEKNKEFVDENKEKFLKKVEKEKEMIKSSSQIDSVFYDKKSYKNVMMMVKENDYEKTWKTRILIKTIPQGGNIIMYYDPYKLGFSYYCDQHMNYNILNSVAMNYVLMYHCYDFFFDECVTPEPSPLLKLLEDDTPEITPSTGQSSQVMKKVEIKDVLKNAPLAKLKNYNKPASAAAVAVNDKFGGVNKEKNKEKENDKKAKEDEKPKERNRFIYMGKVNNFCILKKQPKKTPSIPIVVTNSAYSALFGDSTVETQPTQTGVLNYRDFKNQFLSKK